MRWTPKRAARLGYLAGRGVSMESVLRDRRIGAKSAQALRGIATRWGLHFGSAAAPLLSAPIPPADQEILEQAAAARGLSMAPCRLPGRSPVRRKLPPELPPGYAP